MQVEHGPRAGAELYERVAMQEFQHNDLIIGQRRQCNGVRDFVSKLRHVVARSGDDVETLAQALAKDEELDADFIAACEDILSNEPATHQGVQVPKDLRLRRAVLARKVGNADRLAGAGEALEQTQRQVDGLRGGHRATFRSCWLFHYT
jgi:hypothetical protein